MINNSIFKILYSLGNMPSYHEKRQEYTIWQNYNKIRISGIEIFNDQSEKLTNQ